MNVRNLQGREGFLWEVETASWGLLCENERRLLGYQTHTKDKRQDFNGSQIDLKTYRWKEWSLLYRLLGF
jgi:hypothetical protein